MVIPDDDGEPSNRVIVEVREESQVATFYDRIHGASISVNGHLQVISVFGADFEAGAKNGGRGAALEERAAPQHP